MNHENNFQLPITNYQLMKDSGVDWLGEIPTHWGIRKLKRICRFIYGSSLASQNRAEGKIPVYGSNGITGYHNEAITKKPCIIIGRKGSFGKVNFSEVECYPIDTTYYVDETVTASNLRWLYYILQYVKLDDFSNDVGVPGLNREDAYNRLLPLPPLAEQTAIANFLDCKTAQIDQFVALKEKTIALLQEQKNAIINRAVTQGLNPAAPMKDSGIEWLGDIPAHWEVKKLKHLTKIISKGTTPSTEGLSMSNSGIRFIKAENITESGVSKLPAFFIDEDTHNVLKRSQLQANDILIVIAGATIGKVSILPAALLPANTNQAVSFIRLKQKDCVKFIAYWLRSSFIGRLVRDSSVQSAQPNLSMGNLGNFYIPFPPIPEQHQIVAYTEQATTKIDQAIAQAQQQIDLIKEYRESLISQAVTGKIRVSQP